MATKTPTSRVGLGLAALGRPAYITVGRGNDLGEDRSVDDLDRLTSAVLDAAYAAGIRYFDCARSYGLSERFLAHWLSTRPDATEVTVASKWGYRYVGDWRRDVVVHEVKDHSVDAFRTQLEETRRELGERLSTYQIHSVTPESPALRDRDLLDQLAELRDCGIRIGLSTSGPEQATVIREAIKIQVAGRQLFTVIQSTWNLVEPSAGPALAEAAAAGVSVVVKESLANGRLAPGSDDPSPAVRYARQLAAERGVPLDQVALAAALHQPWAAYVLSGAVTPGQVESNAASAQLALDSETVQRLVAQPQPPTAYWESRAGRTWA
jgi:aryl-alcohol dehydrogenase-like predicted oxidoreductase